MCGKALPYRAALFTDLARGFASRGLARSGGVASRNKEELTGKPGAFRTSGGKAANCFGLASIFEATRYRLLERHSLEYLAGAVRRSNPKTL